MKTPGKHILVASAILGVGCVGLAWATSHAQAGRYSVPSPSMEPTLPFQSLIAVDRGYYGTQAQVKRGDIILYRSPKLPQQPPLVKRVVGLPGDRIRLSGTSTWVDGQALRHVMKQQSAQAVVFREVNGAASYNVRYQPHASAPVRRSVTTTVAPGTFFVLGDNRDDSYDSRYIGGIPFGSIAGKVLP